MSRIARTLFRRSHRSWRLYRTATNFIFRGSALSLARRLAGEPDDGVRKFADATRLLATGGDPQDRHWVERIEQLRVAMLNDATPLVDGALGEPGIYDAGNQTIATACHVSKPPRAALFLYCLARAFNCRRIVELGTNVGISSAYLAASTSRNAAGGQVVTLDSSAYRQRVARRLHEELRLGNVDYVRGLFSATLPSVLDDARPDFAFIDGHHQYQPTLDYLEVVAARTAPGCVIVFDDIDWSDGMRRAWKVIRDDPRFGVVMDFHSVGACVLRDTDGSHRFVSGPHRIF